MIRPDEINGESPGTSASEKSPSGSSPGTAEFSPGSWENKPQPSRRDFNPLPCKSGVETPAYSQLSRWDKNESPVIRRINSGAIIMPLVAEGRSDLAYAFGTIIDAARPGR